MYDVTISDGWNTIRIGTEPELIWKPRLIGEKAVMASGKTVMDVIGVKHTAEIPTGWLCAGDLAKLKRMIQSGVPLTVRYPTPEGERTDVCFAQMPVFRAFRYGEDGAGQWYGVTLTVEQIGTDAV